jgi:hypothetical protein
MGLKSTNIVWKSITELDHKTISWKGFNGKEPQFLEYIINLGFLSLGFFSYLSVCFSYQHNLRLHQQNNRKCFKFSLVGTRETFGAFEIYECIQHVSRIVNECQAQYAPSSQVRKT